MEKIVFEERAKKKKKTTTVPVRVSQENHRSIKGISDRTTMSIHEVTDMLLSFALERVEWKK